MQLLSVTAVVAAELAALVVLVRLGARAPFAIPLDHLPAWVRATEPADAVAALIRLAALAASGWLLLSTVLYLVARVVAAPRALRAVEWATLPAVRRVLDRAVVVVAMGAFVAPAGAATVDVRDGHSGSRPPTSTTSAAATTTTTRPITAKTPTTAPGSVVPVAVVPRAAAPAMSVVVAPGDSLWAIAAAHLAATTSRPRAAISDTEIARYWVAVCDANRARVRSGNLNLIYPGELIVLPALT